MPHPLSPGPYPTGFSMAEPIVRTALAEDLGRAGDITTDSIIPADATATARINARKDGRVAGLEAALLAFRLLDPEASFAIERPDGTDVAPGGTIATVYGKARALLTAERTALNLMGRLSGIATATRTLVREVEGTRARIVCTRKTTPGLRVLEKQAVRLGGGFNHRFGLDDAVLIKDNHLAVAGGIRPAVERVRAAIGHMVKVEVEVDTLAQLEELLDLPAALRVDVVLLDNMDPATLRRAVALVDGRLLTEASGNVTLATVRAIAEAGVDMISCGWLTHSAPNLDIGLDM
ncbi:carboxylating nicotinate-nucleotide diphosphorylase [Azospirillum thermophilum]|uniref:Probable nicotinate-nucleotide pyrophosphorylase [carboxylating] n=2 Tax=Azospirillum thermophilum TaxID=2202148 RepID=A0A2S2CKB6_9PROT|nr:carboxylating nicotinate-nucleotide diphosphorylase [Azospirillum thermophilum]AWK84896.1 carboxylating nicotinate-nucleotide diphosphorylase [Azospirillum thermophilum]